MEELNYKEKRELNEELGESIVEFGDAFDDLIEALKTMERVNNALLKVNVEHNKYMKRQQDDIYDYNLELIGRIKEAIYGDESVEL